MNFELPIEFTNRMKRLLGDEYDAFINSYEDSNYHGLRLNPLKCVHDVKELNINNECSTGVNVSAGLKDSEFYKKIAHEYKLRQVPWCKSGFYYDEDTRPGRSAYHHAGAYYIQEPSAMLVGEVAAPKKGMKVLDLCAAPGGKTSHLAGFMQGEGVLVANELVPARAKILSQNVERMGIKNCIVLNEDARRLSYSLSSYFDLIVVDTPCSGEGMFRRDEIARDEWSPENVDMCSVRGQEILDAADKMLKYGGKLVYSTCTFAPLEDEIAVMRFIQSHPMYRIAKVNMEKLPDSDEADGWLSDGRTDFLTVDATVASEVNVAKLNETGSDTDSLKVDGFIAGDINNTFRLWPHRLHGEGHYVAVLLKGDADPGDTEYNELPSYDSKDTIEVSASKSKKQKKNGKNNSGSADFANAVKLYEEFAKNILGGEPAGEFSLFGTNLYLTPAGAPNLTGLKVERNGLQLGEIKKDRFEPAHALAMCLKPSEYENVYYLRDEDEAVKYLCGESISIDIEAYNSVIMNAYEAGSNYSNATTKKELKNGWCLVVFEGFSLGWGKFAGGMLKNHYPKGLRIMK